MQQSFFFYTEGHLCVSSYTGTGTEFANVSAGLAKVWELVSTALAGVSQEVTSLFYFCAEGKLVANLTSNISYTIYGARFHGEISSHDAGSRLVGLIQQDLL